ncbi:MAG: hypothetical protein ACM359_24900 [Bacillota bacterium]
MVSREDDKYEVLLRRINRAEFMAKLAFIGAGREFDDEDIYLLRRYLSRSYDDERYFGKQRKFFDDEFDIFLRELARGRSSRLERFEHQVSLAGDKQEGINQELHAHLEKLAADLQHVMLAVDDLAQKNADLSAGTHEWLAAQSLGIDTAELKISRFVPLRVYLSDTPEQTVTNVSDAINRLINAFNFEISDDFPPIIGSWFKKWFAKTVDVATTPEVAERLEKIERAIELKGLGLPQADIDKKQADAVAKLLKSIEKIPSAAIQAGSILLVKITSGQGPVIQVRTLTSKELIHLENNQKLLSSPSDILEKLSELCQTGDPKRRENGGNAGQHECAPKEVKALAISEQPKASRKRHADVKGHGSEMQTAGDSSE